MYRSAVRLQMSLPRDFRLWMSSPYSTTAARSSSLVSLQILAHHRTSVLPKRSPTMHLPFHHLPRPTRLQVLNHHPTCLQLLSREQRPLRRQDPLRVERALVPRAQRYSSRYQNTARWFLQVYKHRLLRRLYPPHTQTSIRDRSGKSPSLDITTGHKVNHGHLKMHRVAPP